MKIFKFIGIAMFINGMWENNLVITERKEVSAEDLPFELPEMITSDKGIGGIIGKVPRFPEEGMNEIEGWIVNEETEERVDNVLEQFALKFGDIHNELKAPKDPFLEFLEGLRDTLKGLAERMESENTESEEVKDEKHDHPTEN